MAQKQGTGVQLQCQIGEFDPEKEDVMSYLERFTLFLEVNAIAGASRVKYLLTAVGPATYQVLKNLCVPELPATQTYNELRRLFTSSLCANQIGQC